MLVGRRDTGALQSPRSLVPKPSEVGNAVVFFSRGLGDHILSLPAMRALGQIFRGKLQLLSTHSAPDLFFGDAGLARIVEVDMDFDRKQGPLFDVALAAKKLGASDLFLSIIPGAVAECTQLLRILQPRWSVGFADEFAVQIPTDPGRHAVDEAFALARVFDDGLRPEDFAFPFPLPPESVDLANSIRKNLQGRRLLVIHGETKPHKQWAQARFLEALGAFFSARPQYVGIEIFQNSSIFGDHPPPGVLPISGLPLASSIALAAAADLLVCVDSIFLHAADLWRTATVALFGPTSPDIWGVRFNPMHRYARADSMESLSASQVFRALDELAGEIERLNYRPLQLSPHGNPDLVRWT